MENDINIAQPSQLEPQYKPSIPPLKSKFRPIVLLVTLGIATIGYFASAKYLNVWPFKNLTVINATPTPTETSNLKTYSDVSLGFEFQYPDTVKAGIPIDYTNGQQPDVAYFQTLEYSGKETVGTPEFKKGMYARILVLQNPKNLNLLDFAKTQAYGTYTETPTVINGQTAVVFSYDNSNINPEREAPYPISKYFFQKGPKIFEIDGMTNYKPATDAHIKLFEQVVSTFKFTAPNTKGSRNIRSVSVIKDLHNIFTLQNYKINSSEHGDMWWMDTSGIAVNVRTVNILNFDITNKAQDDYSVENMSSNSDIAKMISTIDSYMSIHGFALQNAQSSSMNPKIEGFVYTRAYYNSNPQTRCRLEIMNPYGGEGETPPYTFTATISCADNQEYTDAYNKQTPFLKVLVNNKDLHLPDIYVVDNDYKIKHCVEDPSIIVIQLDDLTFPGTDYIVMQETGNSWVYLGINGINKFCANYN